MPPNLFLHDFPANPTRFPPWTSLPMDDDPPTTTPYFLVGQISENMTITKPTLILLDRETQSFALTFEDESFSLKGWKKGYTVVVPNARRTRPKEEGKKGFVRVPKGECAEARMIPGGFERVVLVAVKDGVQEERGEGAREMCGNCGGVGGKRCSGCGWVKYCSKECQVKAWSGDHKGDCKIYKGLQELGDKYS